MGFYCITNKYKLRWYNENVIVVIDDNGEYMSLFELHDQNGSQNHIVLQKQYFKADYN